MRRTKRRFESCESTFSRCAVGPSLPLIPETAGRDYVSAANGVAFLLARTGGTTTSSSSSSSQPKFCSKLARSRARFRFSGTAGHHAFLSFPLRATPDFISASMSHRAARHTRTVRNVHGTYIYNRRPRFFYTEPRRASMMMQETELFRGSLSDRVARVIDVAAHIRFCPRNFRL